MQGGQPRPRRGSAREGVTTGTDYDAARRSLEGFAQFVGMPLSANQVEALSDLRTRTTCIVGPRQSGKSRSLAVTAAFHAYTRPGITVLLVSASDDSAKRLLSLVRDLVSTPLLVGSVVDEQSSRITLTTGSRIISVPASERAIRGISADVAICDEAGLLSDDILVSAVLPTLAARPQGRLLIAGTPWQPAGYFYATAQAGNTDWSTVHWWSLRDAPWITPDVLAAARATMAPQRWEAEMEARFVGAGDAVFSPAELLAATAPYELPSAADARGGSVVLGCDWSGRSYDPHAVVALGVVDMPGPPVLFVAHLEASMRDYASQVAAIVALGRPRPRTVTWGIRGDPDDPDVEVMGGTGMTLYRDGGAMARHQAWKAQQARPGWDIRRVVSEAVGVGTAPTESLTKALGRDVVVAHWTSQRTMEQGVGRLRGLISERSIVLPADQDLLRQLKGMVATPTHGGGLTIGGAQASVHDDLADALLMCLAAAIPFDLGAEVGTDPGPNTEWVQAGNGLAIPKRPRPRRTRLFDRSRLMFTT